MISSPILFAHNKLKILDQTKLPWKKVFLEIRSYKRLIYAIRSLAIRGAPALGIAGAYGLYIASLEIPDGPNFKKKIFPKISKIAREIAISRPTAVNLQWAVKRCLEQAKKAENLEQAREILLTTAKSIHSEDTLMCEKIGIFGSKLIRSKSACILTNCNAGSLATGGIGTALGVIYKAKMSGKKIKVFACETRPLLQGSRLTSWELSRANIPVTVICDNMAASVMRSYKIYCIIVGADRIALNGDTANKIGTYALAILAEKHKIPFYVAAPTTTIDKKTKSGVKIPIELRDTREISHFMGKKLLPDNVKVFNPSFDVTPNDLITAIITERGVIKPPYNKKLWTA